jgi:hypothetical protein
MGGGIVCYVGVALLHPEMDVSSYRVYMFPVYCSLLRLYFTGGELASTLKS